MNDQQTLFQIFAENWNVYRQVIDHDYMHHTTFMNYSHAVLQQLREKQEIKVLDLGCGDGWMLAQQLKGQPVSSYTGFDLSGPALAMAKSNFTLSPFPIILREGRMETLIKEEPAAFDLIFSSFAIHHLQDEQKKVLLQDCYDRLNNKGVFIYTDVFRLPGQSRKAYLKEYVDLVNNKWGLLNLPAKQLICEHLQQFDFPAISTSVMEWAAAIGFTVKLFPSPDAWHSMMQFSKP